MDAVDEVLDRVARDPAFREAVRNEPRNALVAWDLSTDDLARIEVELGRFEPLAPSPTVRGLFDQPVVPEP